VDVATAAQSTMLRTYLVRRSRLSCGSFMIPLPRKPCGSGARPPDDALSKSVSTSFQDVPTLVPSRQHRLLGNSPRRLPP
jgi:hypothetical protein